MIKKKEMIRPYVIPSLPFTLRGRDILKSLNMQLITSDQLNIQNFI